ncbi:Remorin 4.2 [Cardamine amara subsp. amara]|uniref:Remorin 4.2 n=1 Tax=Cardamine amara subsp. amara TaxID=228776 RepID=A0ABD1BV65_CARAN
MDYERIGNTQVTSGGGFSPGKLRSMLLGVDRKKKEDEMFESAPTVRSMSNQIDDPVASGLDDCKDVDVVSEITDSSISLGHQEYPNLDYDNVNEIKSVSASSVFEFQKTDKDKAPSRMPIRSFSKPAPSKWDDAQKWIASPTANRPKTGQVQVPGSKKGPSFGRQSSMKIVEVADQRASSFAVEEPDTKRIDVSQMKKDTGQKFVNWEVDSYVKPVLMVENSIVESATEVNLSRHDSSIATAFAQPPSTARSVSMRDMGTEMTPIASQEPSRNGTPIRATTPIRSPISSAPSSPGRQASASPMTNKELSEKELQMKTRREIMVLGTQLGKLSIAAWASKEDEDKDASTSLKTKASLQTSKSVSEARASAWEEAEKAKHMARFRREEMKIQAWENHQKAKSEAEMKKTEVEVERIKGRAQDRLMKKLAAIERKAEEKRAAAEAKKDRQAAKTEKQAEQIRRTGKIPSMLFSIFSFCS